MGAGMGRDNAVVKGAWVIGMAKHGNMDTFKYGKTYNGSRFVGSKKKRKAIKKGK